MTLPLWRRSRDDARMATPVDPNSLAFLLADSRSTPMHVGALQLFEPPTGAGPDFGRELYEQLRDVPEVAPLFRRYPQRRLASAGLWVWRQDDELDVDYHVRRSALPGPGRIRELLELVSQLHGTRLASDRPMWECHVIEGLADGRVALYTKVHHSLIDGVSAMRLLHRVLSPDPDERGMLPPWAARPQRPAPEPTPAPERPTPLGAARQALDAAGDVAGDLAGVVASDVARLPAVLARTLTRSVRGQAGPISLRAPDSVLNRRISAARRFAADDFALDRIRQVSTATGTTINDVVLAMCGGALRRYLLDLGALPSEPLVAMCPVSLHTSGSGRREGGNAIGSVMVQLATEVDDPTERLARISASMTDAKQALSVMTPAQVLAMSGLGVSPILLTTLVHGPFRLPFNVTISNVPGPRRRMYLNGAEMVGMYPVSIPFHGQGLNITCTSYDDQLGFGLTGCRRTVPHLQRLLGDLADELTDLEKAAR